MTPATAIAEQLAHTYPDATCELVHDGAWQLLVATVLSAQCTDVRVNEVTPALFEAFPDVDALAHADVEVVAEMIRPTGLHHTKAKNLVALSTVLLEEHGGEVPRDLASLVALPGVGRKTANVVLGTAYGIPSMPVDTHVQRVTGRLGLSTASSATAIEKQLCAQLPPEMWVDFSHRVILHGRRVCHARRPACRVCPLIRLCPGAAQ